jgi:hypothetical protein
MQLEAGLEDTYFDFFDVMNTHDMNIFTNFYNFCYIEVALCA